MIAFLKKSRVPSALLGLALDEGRLEGVVARRSNGSLAAQKTFAALLALNPLSADPELAGREIRNHLLSAGIHERKCVVCLPASWAFILQVNLPEISEADLPSFLEIEAERGFPYALSTLVTAWSICRGPDRPQFVTLAAIPRNHLAQLDKTLKAARLRPLGFTLAIGALQGRTGVDGGGSLTLLVRKSQVDLQIEWGGGLAALRSLDGSIETEKGEKLVSAELVAPPIRISLGQLPSEIRQAIKTARLVGRPETVRDLDERLAPALAAQGIALTRLERYAPGEFGKRLASETEVSPAFSAAARYILGEKLPLEFQLPKTSSWQQLSGRFSSKRLAWASATTGAVAILAAGLFLVQQWQLTQLNASWRSIEPRVKDLEGLQQQIKKFRPWFDGSLTGLSIMRALAEAFPVEGSVSARTLEIREGWTVTCSGVARDNSALLEVLDKLRSAKKVANLKIDQVRGKSPLQFTFNFQWQEGIREN